MDAETYCPPVEPLPSPEIVKCTPFHTRPTGCESAADAYSKWA